LPRAAHEQVSEGLAPRALGKARARVGSSSERLKKKVSNPAATAAELERAARAFERFTGEPADAIEEYLGPPQAGAAWALGPVPEIHYIATRDGETYEYVHKFRRASRPLLAASHDGKLLYLLGGAYSVTDRGIVDDA
jgi:hypothetical protein